MNMPRLRPALLGTLLATTFAAPASAALTCNSIYGVSLSVGATTEQRCMSTAQQFIDQLSTSQLESLLDTYSITSPATIAARFNDVDVAISFPNSGTTLNFIGSFEFRVG